MKNKNSELKVCVPEDINKIERTIKVLKNVIKTDTNDFDKKMHKEALKDYQSKLRELNNTK